MCYIFLLLAALIFIHVKMNKIYRFPLIFYGEIIEKNELEKLLSLYYFHLFHENIFTYLCFF